MHGIVHLSDLEAYALQLGKLELFSLPRLVDIREGHLDLANEEMRHFAEVMQHFRRHYGLGKTALVTSTDLDYAMGRMYSMLAEAGDPGFRVFRSMEDARAWLSDPTFPS